MLVIRTVLFMSCAVIIAAVFAFVEPVAATGGGGGGGGGGAEPGSHFAPRSNARPRVRKRSRKARPRVKKRSRKTIRRTKARAKKVVIVATATSLGAAIERANTGTARCVKYNKGFYSRRKCLTRAVTQFSKDVTANAKELPDKTPAKPEIIVELAKTIAKTKTKEETLSAIEQARSAFAVSMQLVKAESENKPDEENAESTGATASNAETTTDASEGSDVSQEHADKLKQIEGVLSNVYDAIAAAG